MTSGEIISAIDDAHRSAFEFRLEDEQIFQNFIM